MINWTQEMRDFILKRRSERISMQNIADELGVAKEALYRYCDKTGIYTKRISIKAPLILLTKELDKVGR